MAYATVQDLLARYPERDLAQLSDPEGQAVDDARLQVAIDDASAEMDRYPRAVATLSADELRRICCDIAVYRLMLLRPAGDMQDARRRYEDAISYLQRADEQTVQAGGTVLYDAAPRVFTDESLWDY
jgi:phage gp36-like protein